MTKESQALVTGFGISSLDLSRSAGSRWSEGAESWTRHTLAAQAGPNIRFSPRGTLASLSTRVGSSSSHPCLPTLLPSRSGSIANLLLLGYPLLLVFSLLSRPKYISFTIGRWYTNHIIMVQAHFAARELRLWASGSIFGSNLSGFINIVLFFGSSHDTWMVEQEPLGVGR